MRADQEQQIRKRAHQIWEREGRPNGADKRHWEQAIQEIEQEEMRAKGGTAERYINEAMTPESNSAKRAARKQAPKKAG